METLASPWMLSYNLGCSCLASLALAFLVVCDVRVKGSRVPPGCCFVSHTKIKYTLGHVLVFILFSFTNAPTLFSLSYVRPRLALAPRGLRAHSNSVESCTCTVSSRVTLTRESRRMHLVRVYSQHNNNNKLVY